MLAEIELWLYENVGPGGRLLDLKHEPGSAEWWDGDEWKLVSTPSGGWRLEFRDRDMELLFRMVWR